ncbi:hypothetical protein OG336_00455 [[Kitasatospora] papulosa]|uniref:hypothetical protein n=1 Tax=[Kitasatospora] papulosa TaxID=1464011 RepID=UPI002E124F61|nr:hypothetical protein OG336_00455 [[Kitasatospora] papulosa]
MNDAPHTGAYDWAAAERRQAYANDLGAERSLAAVTAKSNPSKSDQGPAAWLPPADGAHCPYGADCSSTKLLWA